MWGKKAIGACPTNSKGLAMPSDQLVCTVQQAHGLPPVSPIDVEASLRGYSAAGRPNTRYNGRGLNLSWALKNADAASKRVREWGIITTRAGRSPRAA